MRPKDCQIPRRCYFWRMTDENADLRATMEGVRKELVLLNSHRFVRLHNSIRRLVMFQFLRGLAFGLGSVVGATILVSIMAFLLAQINFIPIIGEWAAEIARQIELRNPNGP